MSPACCIFRPGPEMRQARAQAVGKRIADAASLAGDKRKPVSLTSSILGWAYFLCWSLSFYPQLLLNVERRSQTPFFEVFMQPDV